MRQVLDSSSLVALIHKQAGHDPVYRLIERAQEGEADLYLSEVNYGEILYDVARTGEQRSLNITDQSFQHFQSPLCR